MVAGCLTVGLFALGQPHLVARFRALRDKNALRQGQIIATTWYAVVSAIMSAADSMLLVAGTTVTHDLGITRRFRLRALGVAIAPARTLPAIGTSFIVAVICYLLPNTPGDIVERTLPFALGIAILLLGRR